MVTRLQEPCGCWVAIGGYATWCMRPLDHDGECLPKRSELMNVAERLEKNAQAIYDAVTAVDQDGGWPYESPGEGE